MSDTLQAAAPPEGGAERALLDAIAKKDLADVKKIIEETKPSLNLNFVDNNELSPLQHACHIGDAEIARLLVDNGADVNFACRKDGYTALMFAAIGAKANIVRLLLERGVDTTVENCVNRNAAQMAAFVGQSKIVSIITSWVPYGSSVEPYTKVRELEAEPRIPSEPLGRLLHDFVVLPSLHPVKLMLFVKEHTDMAKYGSQFIYVLDDLCSKCSKGSTLDETLSLKYHYLAHVLKFCLKVTEEKKSPTSGEPSSSCQQDFDKKTFDKTLQSAIRRLIKRAQPEGVQPVTPLLDAFITECLYKYPYTQLPVYRTTSFALSKRETGDLCAYSVLTQGLNGPRMFGHPAEACSICLEVFKNKQCSKCQSVYYCGQPCQKIDWFQHKQVCKDPEEKPLLDSEGQS